MGGKEGGGTRLTLETQLYGVELDRHGSGGHVTACFGRE